MLTNEEGTFLLNMAKDTIKEYIQNDTILEIPKDIPKNLKENLGVFVTLNKNKQLRGCIGYPEPIFPVVDAVIKSAIAAATEDPRFPKVDEDELDQIDLELTILTKPKLIEVEDSSEYLDKIIIGKHGLIVEKGYYKGLLLPQVATEHNMDTEEFLSNTCMKAGLDYSCWLDNNVKIFSFEGQIFK